MTNWISVATRLPDANDEFLVWCELHDELDHTIIVEESPDILFFEMSTEDWVDRDYGNVVDESVVVTHWAVIEQPEK